jgi:hypothetical protein
LVRGCGIDFSVPQIGFEKLFAIIRKCANMLKMYKDRVLPLAIKFSIENTMPYYQTKKKYNGSINQKQPQHKVYLQSGNPLSTLK